MSDLKYYFERNKNGTIDKWLHYFEIYERSFSKFREKPISLLEIGVNQGGSLYMWKNYFHPNSQIFGLDINPLCMDLEAENIKIFIGSQDDVELLTYISKNAGGFDIVIDDGSHIMKHQIASFKTLFPLMNEGGIYLCEDTHTSYWKKWGGGYGNSNSYIEYMKAQIDFLHNNYFNSNYFPDFSKYLNCISFYDSIVVVEKKERSEPKRIKSGNPIFKSFVFNDYLKSNDDNIFKKIISVIRNFFS